MSNKLTECRNCKSNGFPQMQIKFQQVGVDEATGKVKWLVQNPDGSTHSHMQRGAADEERKNYEPIGSNNQPKSGENKYEERQKWWAERDAKLDERWKITQQQQREQILILKDIFAVLQRLTMSDVAGAKVDETKQQQE